MSILSRFKESRIGQFWLVYEQKIVLVIGLILIAAISFQAGYLHGQKNKQEPVVVNKVTCAPCPKNETAAINTNSKATSSDNSQQSDQAKIGVHASSENQKCVFVASKNSNKYHLPTCRYAQNIKPENKVCFSSKEEAGSRGFQGAKCCIK